MIGKKFSTIPEVDRYKEQTALPKLLKAEDHVEKNIAVMFKHYAK